MKHASSRLSGYRERRYLSVFCCSSAQCRRFSGSVKYMVKAVLREAIRRFLAVSSKCAVTMPDMVSAFHLSSLNTFLKRASLVVR